MPTVAELGRAKKAQRPGAYDDVPDDQLGLAVQAKHPGAYGDFSPAPPSVPLGPAGLAPDPPPGFGSNLLHSIINFTSPGPAAGPNLTDEIHSHPGENPLAPWPAFRDTVGSVANTFLHPIDALHQDPIAAANTLGSPIQMLTHPKSLAAIREGGPDLAKGTAKLGAEYALHKMGPVSELLDLMGGLKLGLPGVAQAGQGLRKGWDAAKAAPWMPPDITDIFKRPAGTAPMTDPAAAIELVKDAHGDYVPKGPSAQPSAAPPPGPARVTPDLVPPVMGPGNIRGVEEFLKNRTLSDLPTDIPGDQQQRILQHAAEQRAGKNQAMADYFRANKITPEQIRKMSEADYNVHVSAAGKRPSTGKGYSRPHTQAVQDVIDLMTKP